MNPLMFGGMIGRTRPFGRDSNVPPGDGQNVLSDGMKSSKETSVKGEMILDISKTEDMNKVISENKDLELESQETSEGQELSTFFLGSSLAWAKLKVKNKHLKKNKYLNIHFNREGKHFKVSLTGYPQTRLQEYIIYGLMTNGYSQKDAEEEATRSINMVIAGLAGLSDSKIPPFKVNVFKSY